MNISTKAESKKRKSGKRKAFHQEGIVYRLRAEYRFDCQFVIAIL